MIAQTPLLHVRFNGRSLDVPISDLDIGDQSSDDAITQATADFLDLPFQSLTGYKVDRHKTGNITVRPQAVFG